MTDFAVVVNAGGASVRMQSRPKALLPVPPHGVALANTIIDRLAPLSTGDVIVVANDPQVQEKVTGHGAVTKVVADRWPGAGAMGGIATALALCREWAIVVACDMPFVNRSLFELLCEVSRDMDREGRRRWDAVVPRLRGYPQMLHTLYHVDMLPHFTQLIEAEQYKLLNVLPPARVRYVEAAEMVAVDPDLRSFTNVNTAEEWAEALRQLSGESTPPE